MEVPVPSLRWRAFVVLLLLVGFYLSTFVLSAALFVAPCAFLYLGGFKGLVTVLAFVGTWAPAFVILMAVLGARPPNFSPDGIELFPSQNPALYGLVEEVAKHAGTAPPTQIFLMGMPMAGVVETGGLFAWKPKRVLLLGAPLLVGVTIEQLRAILAHEMGHFLGGDTRLGGILSYAHHTFAAVHEATKKSGNTGGFYGGLAAEATHAIGNGYVRLYVRMFLALTRPTSRKQEIAADALSVRLAGRDAAISALECSHHLDALYRAYLDDAVRPALLAGAVPLELLEGFEVFCAKVRERGNVWERLGQLVREQKTDPFDSHPAYSDRVAMMKTFPEGERSAVANGDRSALELVELDTKKLRTWLLDLLVDATGHGRALPRLRWSSIAEKKMPAKVEADGAEIVKMLAPHFPRANGTREVFRAAVGSLADGSFVRVAHQLAPALGQLGQAHRAGIVQTLAASILASLFEASLVERGATIEPSLGEPSLVFVLEGERIFAGDLAARAMTDTVAAEEITRWADRLLPDRPRTAPAQSA